MMRTLLGTIAQIVGTIAKIVAYASSAFIFLPAGRDIVSYGTLLLPGEDNVRPMMTMTSEKARTWMWGMWGFNHCFISLLKILAVMNGDKKMLKLLAASAVATTYYCILGQGAHGDMDGFIVVCMLQVLSLGYLGFAPEASSKPSSPLAAAIVSKRSKSPSNKAAPSPKSTTKSSTSNGKKK